MLRILAVIAALVAVILFIVAALVNAATANPLHYVEWGLAAFAASLALFELEGVTPPVR